MCRAPLNVAWSFHMLIFIICTRLTLVLSLHPTLLPVKGYITQLKHSCFLIKAPFGNASVERILNEYMTQAPEPPLHICAT